MSKVPIGFATLCLALCVSFFGCSTTESVETATGMQNPDRFVQRTLTDHQGKPFLRVDCEYIGQQPYSGYPVNFPWKTKKIDFYNIRFENLTRHKITFISKKVYQKNARHDRSWRSDVKSALIESADFSKQPDSDFDQLEPLEERKLINWSIKASDIPSYKISSIVFQIQYLNQDYTFNIQLVGDP